MRRLGIVACVVVLAATATGQASAPAPKQEGRTAMSASDQQEMVALTNDIARLRALLRQMEMNLALVQTTQTPLKHQFELEMEMWRVTLDGMERRLQRLRGTTSSGVALPATVPLRQDSRQGRP